MQAEQQRGGRRGRAAAAAAAARRSQARRGTGKCKMSYAHDACKDHLCGVAVSSADCVPIAAMEGSCSGEQTILQRQRGQPSSTGSGNNNSRDTPTTKPQLFSSWFCPYAQRAWIALEELGVDYTWCEVQPYVLGAGGNATKNPKSLAQKDREYPGFIAASPHGLVPALVHGPTSVHDSLRVVGYIDNMWGGGRLGTHRADVQTGIAIVQQHIVPHFYRLLMAQGA
jgi:hypothetical protein